MGSGFEASRVYLGAEGEAAGGRYVHAATGVPLRVLRIPTVPQAFIHVSVAADSDRGEAHTGEHLLLGKGARGRALAAAEEMRLVESTAFTAAGEVCYALNCAAGQATFLAALGQTLEALLFPDYSDDEIRREVCWLGVVTDPATGTLRLDEKGTVYTEMVAACEKRWVVFHEVDRALHGPGHPLAWRTGGTPEAIRTLGPEQVRRFHAAHYHLSPNLGVVLNVPPAWELDPLLDRLDRLLSELAARPGHSPRPAVVYPPPRPERPAGVIRAPYPCADGNDPVPLVAAWPIVPAADVAAHYARRLLLEAFADGETSHLHRVLIDRSTRRLPLDAARVWGGLDVAHDGEGGQLGLSGLPPRSSDDASVARLLEVVHAELDLVVRGEVDGFARRVETRLLELERGLKRRLSLPPGFGARGGTSSWWLDHLRLVERAPGATCRLVPDELGRLRAAVTGGAPPWADVVRDLALSGPPIVGVSVPSPAEATRRADERAARLRAAEEAARARHGGAPLAVALAAEKAEEERTTAALDALAGQAPRPRLVDDTPRTLDDDLVTDARAIGGVPALRALAEVSPVEVALAFRLDLVAEDELVLLPLLPSLISSVGLREGEARLLYDDLRDRLDREVGDVAGAFDLQPDTGRLELFVAATGVDLAEGRLAVEWLARCLTSPDLSEENLPRLRDLARQMGKNLRAALGGSEEGWVRNPAWALRWQRDRRFLSIASIHAKLFHAARLVWLLEAPPQGDDAVRTAALLGGLDALVGLGAAPVPATLERVRAALAAGRWTPGAEPDALDELAPTLLEGCLGQEHAAWREGAGGALLETLLPLAVDLPPASAAGGPSPLPSGQWGTLLRLVADSLAVEPATVLARLRRLHAAVLRPAHARFILSGRRASLDALEGPLAALVTRLDAAWRVADPAGADRAPVTFDEEPLALARVRARQGDVGSASHWGLVHAGASTGVLVHGADLGPGGAWGPGGRSPGPSPATDRDDLLDLLAGSLDAGGGPQAFFMRTWAAGLAYSNGLRVGSLWGRISYYAERCPDLVQTQRFVVELAKDEARYDDPWLVEYALAQLVGSSRAADRLESRARAWAADAVDGLRPEAVAAQRQALLALREEPGLVDLLAARRLPLLRRALVGLGAPTPARDRLSSVFLAIGPERLLGPWAGWLEASEPGERLLRIWPADLWVM